MGLIGGTFSICSGRSSIRSAHSTINDLQAPRRYTTHNTDPMKRGPSSLASSGHCVSQWVAQRFALRPAKDNSSAFATLSTQMVFAPRIRPNIMAKNPGAAPVVTTTSGLNFKTCQATCAAITTSPGLSHMLASRTAVNSPSRTLAANPGAVLIQCSRCPSNAGVIRFS